MLSFLPPPVRGALALLLLVVNTLFWCVLMIVPALLKLALPFDAARSLLDPVLNGIGTGWTTCNSLWLRLTQQLRWDVDGLDELDGLPARGWYLVCCNHQSWADILVLQHLLSRRVPMLKFFLKQQLIYVPVIGLAWWALDFPFMRRHSSRELLKHPEKRLEDLEAARRASSKFARVPTTVVSFVEGTRFTPDKHAEQRSPYAHLLKPKAGALALTLGTLGSKFEALLDFTIVYPDGTPTFWEFLCGRSERVIVRMTRQPIPPEFCVGDCTTDRRLRKQVQRWLQDLWQQKDRLIESLLRCQDRPAPTTRGADR